MQFSVNLSCIWRNMVACLLLFIIVGAAHAMESSKVMEGYPAGYLADCPGSNKEAFISKKTLKNLTMFVINEKGMRIRYDYYHMKELAKDPNVDFSKKTMLFVGGYLSSPIFPFSSSMGNAYKKIGYNVLMLDTVIFTTIEYPRAARFMRPVGKHVAEMLVDLTEQGLDPKQLEVVGMSLGGQTISFIAKSYKELTGVNIGKLLALEPAGPCFRNLGPMERLDKSDADFVIVINTNIDGYGMAAPVGHVNFYVNGGEFQPGDLFWFFCPDFCSHVRSYNIWMSSLKHPNSFIAVQCDTVQQARNKDCFDRVPQVTNVLGPNTDRNKEGIFYLSTSGNDPFYLGKKGLNRQNDYLISLTESFNKEDHLKM